MNSPDLAVIFVPAGADAATFTATCLDYCRARGYQVLGVVTGDGQNAFDLLREGKANVIVMARPEHRDPTWEPRVEFVTDAAPALQKHDNSRSASLRQRRPRRLV